MYSSICPQTNVNRMIPTTKLLRCIKSPLIMSTFLFSLIYYILIRHQSNFQVRIKRDSKSNTTIFISSSLQREIEGLCPLLEPSENDMMMLQGKFHPKISHLSKQDNKLVCDVIKMCDRFTYTVQCRTTECGEYRVDFTLIKSSKSNITMDLMEKIIFDQIFNERDDGGDLGSKLQVFCEKTYLSQPNPPIRLSLDILYSENKFCYDNHQIPENIFNSQELFPFDIRFFHFTHITRNEFMSKFNNFASVHLSLLNEKVEVVDFKRVQAENLDEIEMLNRILPELIYTDKHSTINNLCFNVLDLTCNISYERQKFLHKFLNNTNGPCREIISLLAENSDIVQSFCNRISKSEKRSKDKRGLSHYYDFYSLFTMAHITNTFEYPLITTSMVNSSEIQSYQIEYMDKALTNIVSELLAKQNSIVIIASDVGRPPALSLKTKEFFHVEKSNPMFYILLPKRLRLCLGVDLMSILKINSYRLISTADIQRTIIDLMDKSIRLKIQKSDDEVSYRDGVAGHSLLDPGMISRSCSEFDITPPLLCICEGVFVSYPNDTIQIAFVEFVIGTINKELSENNVSCSYISGVMFNNVRIAHYRGSRSMKFDLDVSLDRYGTIYQLYNLQIYFNGFSPSSNFDIKMKELDVNDKKILSEFSQLGCTSYGDVSYPLNLEYANLKGFGVEPEIVPLHQQCLMLVIRNYGDSVTYIIGNFCESRQYRVKFNLDLVNMISTVPLPVFLSLNSGDVQFLSSVTKQSYNIHNFSHNYNYDVHYDIFP